MRLITVLLILQMAATTALADRRIFTPVRPTGGEFEVFASQAFLKTFGGGPMKTTDFIRLATYQQGPEAAAKMRREFSRFLDFTVEFEAVAPTKMRLTAKYRQESRQHVIESVNLKDGLFRLDDHIVSVGNHARYERIAKAVQRVLENRNRLKGAANAIIMSDGPFIWLARTLFGEPAHADISALMGMFVSMMVAQQQQQMKLQANCEKLSMDLNTCTQATQKTALGPPVGDPKAVVGAFAGAVSQPPENNCPSTVESLRQCVDLAQFQSAYQCNPCDPRPKGVDRSWTCPCPTSINPTAVQQAPNLLANLRRINRQMASLRDPPQAVRAESAARTFVRPAVQGTR